MKKTAQENPQIETIGADEFPKQNKKIFSLLNDFVFKCVFGQEKHEQIAICLLNALLKKSGIDKIVSLEFLNPFNLKEATEQKASAVDVKVRDGKSRTYIIEVQVCKDKFFVARTVYYLAKLYSGQLQEGEDYSKLKPSTIISILDFDLFEESEEMHNIFEFRDQKGMLCLSDIMALHYIELTKFSRNKPRHLKTPFEKWLDVLKFSEKYITMETLPDYLADEEGVPMAVASLKKINADREMRQILEAREKEARYVSMLKTIANEEGQTTGERRKQAEIALKLFKKGLPVDLILETTGLSEEELNELVKSSTQAYSSR